MDWLTKLFSSGEQERYNDTVEQLDAARRRQVERGILSEENYQRSAGGRADTSDRANPDGSYTRKTGPLNVEDELEESFDEGFDDGVENISTVVRAPFDALGKIGSGAARGILGGIPWYVWLGLAAFAAWRFGLLKKLLKA